MASGPFEFVVIAFEADRFTSKIIPQLRKLQEKGVIQLADLLFLKKDAQGTVVVTEISDLQEEEAQAYMDLTSTCSGLLSVEDVEQLAADLPLNCSAAIVLFEHSWAADLKETIVQAQGKLLAGGLVPSDTIDQVRRELATPISSSW